MGVFTNFLTSVGAAATAITAPIQSARETVQEFLGLNSEIEFECSRGDDIAQVNSGSGFFGKQSIYIGDKRTDDPLHFSNSTDSYNGRSFLDVAQNFCETGNLPRLSTDWTTSTGPFSSMRNVEGPGGNYTIQQSLTGNKTTGVGNGESLISKFLIPSQVLDMAMHPKDSASFGNNVIVVTEPSGPQQPTETQKRIRAMMPAARS